MATETDMAPNREIDQVLNQTEVGEWIAKNKTAVIGLVVLIIVGVFGWGGYQQVADKKAQKYGDRIYKFQEGPYTQLIDKKLAPAEFVTQFKALRAEVKDYMGLAPLVIKSADHLVSQEAYKEAVAILEEGRTFLKTPILNNVLSLHLATAFENLNDYPKAIATLEELNTSSMKLMEDKIYLDLGRLYLASGNKEKAKTNLQYLVDNGKEAEFMKLAKLYLEDLEQGK